MLKEENKTITGIIKTWERGDETKREDGVEAMLPEGGCGKVVKIQLRVLTAVIVSSSSSPFAFAFSTVNSP